MSSSENIQLPFNWPAASSPFAEEFFCGFWHPRAEVAVVYAAPPAETAGVSCAAGKNWSIVSSRSPFHPDGRSLAHTGGGREGEAETDLVAFRGYLLSPPVHSWSDPVRILEYWTAGQDSHNGVFASLVIDNGGGRLRLITDAFGIATLYFRKYAGGVLFSTNSRYLACERDGTDLLAARTMLHCGAVYGDRTLTEGIHRVPAGTVLEFQRETCRAVSWFSCQNLRNGFDSLTPASLQRVEDALVVAVERCLALEASDYVLPLSSGYDSRRILAMLLAKKVPFKALTVKVLQKQNRDLDAVFAAQMARDFGFQHTIVDQPQPRQYAQLDLLRRLLLDSHSCDHTWFLSLFPHLPSRPSLVFDGLGGDVLGETGFEVHAYHSVDEPAKLPLILSRMIGDQCDAVLNPRVWPGKEEVRGYLESYLEHIPYGNNRADLAFMLMRCRSGTGLCFQRLIPAGHVTVYPYLDLDFVAAALRVDPMVKLAQSLQALCLQRFWPEFFNYHGSRNVPNLPPGDSSVTHRRMVRCARQLLSEVAPSGLGELFSCLTGKSLLKVLAGRVSDPVLVHLQWWLIPLLSTLSRKTNNKGCWPNRPC